MSNTKTLRQMDDEELEELIDTTDSEAIMRKALEEMRRRHQPDRHPRSEEQEESES